MQFLSGPTPRQLPNLTWKNRTWMTSAQKIGSALNQLVPDNHLTYQKKPTMNGQNYTNMCQPQVFKSSQPILLFFFWPAVNTTRQLCETGFTKVMLHPYLEPHVGSIKGHKYSFTCCFLSILVNWLSTQFEPILSWSHHWTKNIQNWHHFEHWLLDLWKSWLFKSYWPDFLWESSS